jgi:hypothetical protein
VPTKSGNGSSYDPWKDLNDDGVVDSTDLGMLGTSWATTGDPVNKTALLYDVNATLTELLSRIEQLNATLMELDKRVPKKGVLTISPISFNPMNDTQRYLKYEDSLRGEGTFLMQLHLPHGVTITNMTVYLRDYVADGRILVALWGYNWWDYDPNRPPAFFLAGVYTTDEGTPGDTILFDDSIEYATIDERNIYILGVLISYYRYDMFLELNLVQIEYQY